MTAVVFFLVGYVVGAGSILLALHVGSMLEDPRPAGLDPLADMQDYATELRALEQRFGRITEEQRERLAELRQQPEFDRRGPGRHFTFVPPSDAEN